MSTSKRKEEILGILNKRNFITVNELAEITFTSPSSIRRDLTAMENLGLVKRSHGGVSLPESINLVTGFRDRMHKNKIEKRLIAKKAAVLLKEGKNIMLDNSSTVGFLLPYIAKLNSVTVFTTNLTTAINASELGIETHLIGGRVVNGSIVIPGVEVYNMISHLNVDILFFSAESLDQDGTISNSQEADIFILNLMLKSAKKSVFLCDSEKFGKDRLYKLTHLDNIDVAVFDKEFEGLEIKTKVL